MPSMRDPDTIEREIAAERERLAASLRAIEARLSPEALVQKAATSRSEVARDSPLALALIGSGVAWLYASATRPEDATPGPDAAPRPHHQEGDKTMPMTGTGLHDPDTQFDADPGTREGLRRTAEDLRARLSDGLDAFPDEARARILEARLKAIEAQSAIEAKAARGADTVRRGADEHPLLVGAIAFGLGAAIAAALPRTTAENRTLGAQRDRLMDEADRIFREETDKLRSVAESAVAEGRDAVKDTLQRGRQAEDGPVERVHQTTRREARRQHLGEVT
jgi:hypothetical protein